MFTFYQQGHLSQYDFEVKRLKHTCMVCQIGAAWSSPCEMPGATRSSDDRLFVWRPCRLSLLPLNCCCGACCVQTIFCLRRGHAHPLANLHNHQCPLLQTSKHTFDFTFIHTVHTSFFLMCQQHTLLSSSLMDYQSTVLACCGLNILSNRMMTSNM